MRGKNEAVEPEPFTVEEENQDIESPEECAFRLLKESLKSAVHPFIREIIDLKCVLFESGLNFTAYPLCNNLETDQIKPISEYFRKQKELSSRKKAEIKSIQTTEREIPPSEDTKKKKAKEWDDIWSEEVEERKETYSDPNLYFGKTAKDKFWDMFKNYRTFKDVSKVKGEEDPRFAYIKQCKEEHIIPKIGLVIGEMESDVLDFEEKGLTSRTVRALADTISKYKLKVNTFKCGGNLLRDSDCQLLLKSLQHQYPNLVHLSFRNNKIGSACISGFVSALDKIKQLESLDLSENLISDELALQLLEAIEKHSGKLKVLSFSRNFIGKTIYASGMANAFAVYGRKSYQFQ